MVVTSANKEELADLLREAAVADLLVDAITASDADASKPEPDLVEAALDKLGLGPREVVMVGDTRCREWINRRWRSASTT